MDDGEPVARKNAEIVLGADLTLFSVEDLDERIELMRAEITRCQQERVRKQVNLDAAEAFFKQ